MRNKFKMIPWTFLPLDYKAMEVYLEDMAKRGWMLEKIGIFMAKFRAIEPKNIKFYVDILKYGGPFTPENTRASRVYRRKCEELGWNFITSQRYLQFFYAEEGQNPELIQNDEDTEFTAIKRTLLKEEFINSIISMIFLYIIIRNSFPLEYKALLSYINLFIVYGFPLLAINTIYRFIHTFSWLFKNSRNIKKGLPIEIPTLGSARKRGKILNGLILTYGIGLIMAIIMDILITSNVSLLVILPAIFGTSAGLLIRHLIKKKAKDKGDTIGYIIVGTVSTMLIVSAIGSIYISKTMKTSNYVDSIPVNYPLVTMEDLSEVAKEGNLESRKFEPGRSLVIPKYYGFWESWRVSGSRKGIYVYYYEAVSPYFTDIVFSGKTEEINTVLGWRSKSLTENEEVKDLYNADRLLISRDRYVVLIQKGNKVVHLSGDVDFGDMKVIEKVLDKLF